MKLSDSWVLGASFSCPRSNAGYVNRIAWFYGTRGCHPEFLECARCPQFAGNVPQMFRKK